MTDTKLRLNFLINCDIDGIPYDGAARDIQHPLHTAITIVYFFLASIGLVYTLLCLLFNTLFKDRK